MATSLACPDRRDLERLARGQLPEPAAGQVCRHVLACCSCADLLNSFQEMDWLVPNLQSAPGQQPHDNPFVESLVERLVRTPPDSAGITLPLTSGNDLTAGQANNGSLPERVPDFEILGELGRGAMGVVYKARHVRLNRLVALKMIAAGTEGRYEELAPISPQHSQP
jgi:hypothetical protein